MKQALIFPGQGAQTVGMGRDLTEAFQEAKQTFEEADDLLGFSLSSIAWEGPEEVLTETRHAQPALYVHSMAAYRVIQARIGEVSFAAGHSLGELSAHAAAGTYSFAEGLEAVRRRGELMFAVGEEVPGAMAAVLGLDDDVVVDLCKQAQDNGTVVVPANFNSPGQVVVSGSEAGVDWCVSEAPERGARKAVRLNVSGAFHSPLMAPVAESFEETLNTLTFSAPQFPVVSNVTAQAVQEGDAVAPLLVQQLTSPVQWVKSVTAMGEAGVERFIEVGPGRVLAGLNRRITRGIRTVPCGTVEDIERLLQEADA